MGEAAKRYLKKQEDHEDRNRRIEARIEKDIQRGLDIAKQTSQVLNNRMNETKETLAMQTERKVRITVTLLLPVAAAQYGWRGHESHGAQNVICALRKPEGIWGKDGGEAGL